MGEPDADFDTLLGRTGRLMETIEHAEGWELDSRIEQAMDALRCPPGDAAVTNLSGGERAASRCASCCSSSPTCCCSTSRPTTSTPRASSGWSSTWPSTRAPSWP